MQSHNRKEEPLRPLQRASDHLEVLSEMGHIEPTHFVIGRP